MPHSNQAKDILLLSVLPIHPALLYAHTHTCICALTTHEDYDLSKDSCVKRRYSLALYAAISLEVTWKCSHALPFHVVLWRFSRETPAMHVQLSQASSNHVIERWASSVYRYSQSFSTVKRKQSTVPHVELTKIIWHHAVCNRFHGYGQSHLGMSIWGHAQNVNLCSRPGTGTQVSLDTYITRWYRDDISWRQRTGKTAWLALCNVRILRNQVHKRVLNAPDS